jgi:hypothetical protein
MISRTRLHRSQDTPKSPRNSGRFRWSCGAGLRLIALTVARSTGRWPRTFSVRERVPGRGEERSMKLNLQVVIEADNGTPTVVQEVGSAGEGGTLQLESLG